MKSSCLSIYIFFPIKFQLKLRNKGYDDLRLRTLFAVQNLWISHILSMVEERGKSIGSLQNDDGYENDKFAYSMNKNKDFCTTPTCIFHLDKFFVVLAAVARRIVGANYHRNVYVLILLNHWLTLTMLRVTGPWFLSLHLRETASSLSIEDVNGNDKLKHWTFDWWTKKK